jgi:hypothetical protein
MDESWAGVMLAEVVMEEGVGEEHSVALAQVEFVALVQVVPVNWQIQ